MRQLPIIKLVRYIRTHRTKPIEACTECKECRGIVNGAVNCDYKPSRGSRVEALKKRIRELESEIRHMKEKDLYRLTI